MIGDEDLFIEFMGRFSPKDNQLLFAADLREALQHCQTAQPEVFVLPLDRGGQELTSILTEAVRLDAQVLGLSANGDERPPEYVTRLAPMGDVEAAYAAVAELLEERRQWPRTRHQLMVEVDGLGTLRSVSISATSIFVVSEAPLEPGVQVTISVKVTDGELSGRATVTRVGIGEDGNLGMVLAVSPDSVSVCHFLESLVRQLLQQEHEQQQEDDLPPAPVAPVDPLGEHHLSALNQALDVVVGEVASLRQQVEAGQGEGARLEALEARAAEQQEALASQLEVSDQISGRLERLSQQQQAQDEALARRAEEEQGGTERLDQLEASIEAAQKSASYVEESRAGLKSRLEDLERGRTDQEGTLERQGEQLAALESGRSGRVAGLEARLERLETLSGEAKTEAVEAREALGQQVELAQQALQSLERSIGLQDGHIEALSGRVEGLEALDERVGALDSLGERVEKLEVLGERVEKLEALGDRVGALDSLGDRVEKLEALGDRVEKLEALGDRVEKLEALGERVGALEALGERVEGLTGQIAEVQQTFDEVRDEVTDLMGAIAGRVEEVAGASVSAEALERLSKGLKAVGEQQEQLNKTLAEQNKVVVKVVQRLDRMES